MAMNRPLRTNTRKFLGVNTPRGGVYSRNDSGLSGYEPGHSSPGGR